MGEITYRVLYREEVLKKDLKKLSFDVKKIIAGQIQKKLTTHPEIFGKPLRNSLFGFRSLRVNDYRVAFEIILPNTVVVRAIDHRSIIYKMLFKRLKIK